jgi:sulfite reductase (NADPH) flavoprotein alpha-component
MTEFSSFKQTKLSDVRKIEFPFIEDDPDENFVIQLKNKTISVNQINGAIVESKATPKTEIYENMNLKLHTGRGNWLLALVLGISSLGVLAFIYTGFAITRKRTKNKIKNSFSAENAEIIILVGSENGSTMGFANTIHHQFLSLHKKSYLSTLNRYQPYPKAEHLILMTSTYGLGDAPSNANQFEKLLNTILQQQIIKVSIVGFGSKSYEEYAAFAEKIQNKIGKKDLFQIITPLVKINDASTHDFVEWAKAWSAESMIPLATTPSLYAQKKQHLKTFEVVGKTEIVEETTTFTLILKPKQKSTFQSGDLLAIYPNHDGAVRYYSVGKVGGNIQLVVKLHKNGLGSGYLYHLNTGHELKAKIMVNEDFHCTKKMKSVIMIANGTGIAPFLGLMM